MGSGDLKAKDSFKQRSREFLSGVCTSPPGFWGRRAGRGTGQVRGERGTGCRGRNQRGRYILNAICVPLKSIVRCGHEADCCLRDACLMPFRTPSESWGGGDPQGQGSSFCSAGGIYPGSIHDNRVAGQRTERRTCSRGSCFASAATSGTHASACSYPGGCSEQRRADTRRPRLG